MGLFCDLNTFPEIYRPLTWSLDTLICGDSAETKQTEMSQNQSQTRMSSNYYCPRAALLTQIRSLCDIVAVLVVLCCFYCCCQKQSRNLFWLECLCLQSGTCQEARRMFTFYTALATSILIHLILFTLYLENGDCWREYYPMEKRFHIIIFTISMILFNKWSQCWRSMKEMKGDSADGYSFIQENLDQVPKIVLDVDCYHYEIRVYHTEDGIKRIREKITTFDESQFMPYSTWWVDGGISTSKTLINTVEDKFTFVCMEFESKHADERTRSEVESERSRLHALHSDKDEHCDVTDRIFCPVTDSKKKFSLKDPNMEVPIIAQGWFFWLFTIIPFPFFNGVLIRFMIKKWYSNDVQRKVIRYVQITDDPRSNDPAKHTERGLQFDATTRKFYQTTMPWAAKPAAGTYNNEVVPAGMPAGTPAPVGGISPC